MRHQATTSEHQAAQAQALLADEFAEALATDPRTPVSTPGFTLHDEQSALRLVEHMLADEADNHTLEQLLLVCNRHAAKDVQARAVLRSLAVRFAAAQVQRLTARGAIESGCDA